MTPLAAIDRLFEAHLIVADIDASIAFYRDRLGLELAHVEPARRAAFFWVGARGNSMLEPMVLAWMPAAAVYFLDPDGHLLEYVAMLEGEPRPDERLVEWRAWHES